MLRLCGYDISCGEPPRQEGRCCSQKEISGLALVRLYPAVKPTGMLRRPQGSPILRQAPGNHGARQATPAAAPSLPVVVAASTRPPPLPACRPGRPLRWRAVLAARGRTAAGRAHHACGAASKDCWLRPGGESRWCGLEPAALRAGRAHVRAP